MSEEGWIEWRGGFNPTPVCAVVEVRHRDGGFGSNRNPSEAGEWDQGDYKGWVHNGSGYDIVAYRLAHPTPGDSQWK